MSIGITIDVHHIRGTIVKITYSNSTADETFTVPDRRLTLAEAVALVAVNLRMNGPPDAVKQARAFSEDDNGPYLYTDDTVR